MAGSNRRKPSVAGVIATVALFVALGGGAYAAGALPAGSVGPKQLKKNAVERSKIKNNAVDGSKVADGSLTGADVNAASLTAVGSAAALDRVVYKTAAVTAPAGGATAQATVSCDAGQHVVGGGGRVDDPNNAYIIDTYPDAANTAWTARASAGSVAVNLTVYAICTNVVTAG
jgi:hypothetical protein